MPLLSERRRDAADSGAHSADVQQASPCSHRRCILPCATTPHAAAAQPDSPSVMSSTSPLSPKHCAKRQPPDASPSRSMVSTLYETRASRCGERGGAAQERRECRRQQWRTSRRRRLQEGAQTPMEQRRKRCEQARAAREASAGLLEEKRRGGATRRRRGLLAQVEEVR